MTFAAVGAALLPAFGQAAPFDEAPVSESTLADSRGGFALPGGGQISVAVQSDTRVNGELVLRTVLIAAQSAPTLSVFVKTDKSDSTQTSQPLQQPQNSLTIAGPGGTTINVTTRAPNITNAVPDGMTQVALSPGQTVTTAVGDVRYDKTGAASQIVLNAPDLEVRQLVGQAFGTIVSNRGNDVAIDTSTMINLDLTGMPPLSLGSTLPRIDGLALDAARFGH
jgi:hypothetical protein